MQEAADAVWRRSKLGLRMTAEQIAEIGRVLDRLRDTPRPQGQAALVKGEP